MHSPASLNIVLARAETVQDEAQFDIQFILMQIHQPIRLCYQHAQAKALRTADSFHYDFMSPTHQLLPLQQPLYRARKSSSKQACFEKAQAHVTQAQGQQAAKLDKIWIIQCKGLLVRALRKLHKIDEADIASAQLLQASELGQRQGAVARLLRSQ